MRDGIAKLADLRGRIENVALADRSSAFNASRIECLELQNLFETAEATAILPKLAMRVVAPMRRIYRAGTENWLCHSSITVKTRGVEARREFTPNTVETFQPKARSY